MYFLTTLYVDVKEPAPKFFGVNSPHISGDKKTQSRRPTKITACRAVVLATAGFRFRCRDKIESNLQSQMYKNRLLIRGVPRLAGFEITERRGLVKSIFWNFLAAPSHASKRKQKGREGRFVRRSCQRPLFGPRRHRRICCSHHCDKRSLPVCRMKPELQSVGDFQCQIVPEIRRDYRPLPLDHLRINGGCRLRPSQCLYRHWLHARWRNTLLLAGGGRVPTPTHSPARVHSVGCRLSQRCPANCRCSR